MTRYPQQGPPQGSYQGSESYSNQQPQYGQNDSNYGAYNSGEDQGYGQTPTSRPQQYGGEVPGAAQSYYATNSQAYQQYPSESQPQYVGQQYQGMPPMGQQQQQQPSPHMQSQPAYSGHAPPPMQSPPVYPGQQYSPQNHTLYGQPPHPAYDPQGGDDVAAFRTHYEQPYGPVDAGTGQPMQVGADADRGFMGAMAGGAAGAYGGHKINHGILGGLGGAVAGSMAENAYKRSKKEKKPKQRRGSHSSHSSSSDSSDSDDEKKKKGYQGHESRGVMAGNFSASSREVRLERNCILVAECTDTSGRHQRSTLDLNDCFTNSNGRLCWAKGGNFAGSAKDISLAEGGSVLEAKLGDGRGGWQRNSVRLNERITNDDGRLLMLHV
ncbi:hypothetical protein LTR08_000657 [Meristemomyces frigidus]|nr:hypothetical protein LTR08_000657 [Meristemomyces frigidus]